MPRALNESHLDGAPGFSHRASKKSSPALTATAPTDNRWGLRSEGKTERCDSDAEPTLVVDGRSVFEIRKEEI